MSNAKTLARQRGRAPEESAPPIAAPHPIYGNPTVRGLKLVDEPLPVPDQWHEKAICAEYIASGASMGIKQGAADQQERIFHRLIEVLERPDLAPRLSEYFMPRHLDPAFEKRPTEADQAGERQ